MVNFEQEVQKNLISDAERNLLTGEEMAGYIAVLKRLEKINEEHRLQLIEEQLLIGATDELSKRIAKLISSRVMKTIEALKIVAIILLFCSLVIMFFPVSCK